MSKLPPPFKPKASLKQKLKDLLQQSKKSATNILSLLLIFGSAGVLVLKTPQIHRLFLREKVGNKVYMIKASAQSGGGTGFALKAPSGQSYIVTNSEVCDYINKVNTDGMVLVMDDEGHQLRRRILEISDSSDLCLIEGMPGVEGLSIGGEVHLGQEIYAVGHPRLRPLTITSGDVVGATDVPILDGIMEFAGQPTNYDGKCDKPKNKIEEVQISFFGLPLTVKVCLVITKDAYMSTVTIHPGSSGSPAVNALGQVVGVMFAADETNWGMIVNRSDLLQFLSQY